MTMTTMTTTLAGHDVTRVTIAIVMTENTPVH
jgi:hypothetical protein